MNRLVYQILIFSGISALSLATSSVVNTAITAQAQQKDSGNKTTLRQSISPTIPKTLTQQELNEQSVMAIDWVQQSGEYRALTYQAFNCAKLAFDNAIAKGIKNPAAIVDIDETILDNSPYQAGLIDTDKAFSPATWNQWIKAKKARAIPGAVEFVNYVTRKGKVFFISDRDESSTKDGKNNDLELATLVNLKALGFTGVNEHSLLLKGEFSKIENGKKNTSKQLRRAAIEGGKADGKTYKIIVLVGDNLNDLDAEAGITNDTRRFHVDANRNRYGIANNSKERDFEPAYVMLPNPMYGAWESGLYDPQAFGQQQWFGLMPSQKSQQRKQALSRWQD
jgi:5'-nucleotidase (lipoprotein e(P4) family)